MILLGIDLETTGTDIENDSIVEIAAVLWDAEAQEDYVKRLSEILEEVK